MIARELKPRCSECNRITDRVATTSSGSVIWLCADCEYLAMKPDAPLVKRERKRAQSETLFGGDSA